MRNMVLTFASTKIKLLKESKPELVPCANSGISV